MSEATEDSVPDDLEAYLEAVESASTTGERRDAIRQLAKYNRDRNRETYDRLEKE